MVHSSDNLWCCYLSCMTTDHNRGPISNVANNYPFLLTAQLNSKVRMLRSGAITLHISFDTQDCKKLEEFRRIRSLIVYDGMHLQRKYLIPLQLLRFQLLISTSILSAVLTHVSAHSSVWSVSRQPSGLAFIFCTFLLQQTDFLFPILQQNIMKKKTLTKQRNVTAKGCINPEPCIILNFFKILSSNNACPFNPVI